MSEIIIDAEQQEQFRDTVAVLLGGVGIDKKTIQGYSSFLLAEEGDYRPVNRPIKHASIALGRLYFCSMSGKHSDELTYEPNEQLMLSLMTGRTVKEDPKPIVAASIEYAESHTQSDLVVRPCIEFAFSGIQKLRSRSVERPKLFTDAEIAIKDTNTRFKLF